MDKIEWKCPKCGALPNRHGRGRCRDRLDGVEGICSGFICECDNADNGDDHGESYSDPCFGAMCYHCGWRDEFPKPPAKWPKWTKTALAEGWTPPKGWQP